MPKINVKPKGDDELLAAASLAYYRAAEREGSIPIQPSHSRSYVHGSKRKYVVLYNVNGYLATYAVCKDGRRIRRDN